MTELKTFTVEDAAQLLVQGQLVAFPTETVFGLGADAENPEAVAKIFAAKGRPSNHPLIVHVAPEVDLQYWVEGDVPEIAQCLIKAYWPGPLTLILPRAHRIPADVAGGQDSIGLRSPAHPVALALLRAFKNGRGGIAAPSANQFGHVSPTTAEHVRSEFPEGYGGPAVSVLEGSASEVGIESTILDLSRLHLGVAPRLLRPGKITAPQIEHTLGDLIKAPILGVDAEAPRASGLLDSHYAPRTPLAQVEAAAFNQTYEALRAKSEKAISSKVVYLSYGIINPNIKPTIKSNEALTFLEMPKQASDYAQQLYAMLRKADDLAADWIWVEPPPQGEAWLGIQDRLGRACFATQGLLPKLS